MTRFSEAVILTRIDDELNRNFHLSERHIEFLRLRDWHARIDLAVHNHRRRLDVLDVFHRRTIPVEFLCVPGRFIRIKPAQVTLNIVL